MSDVPYQQPSPPPGHQPELQPANMPRPKTVKVLVTLGIVFGGLVLVCGAVGMVGSLGMTLDKHRFDGGHLSVELEADKVYDIKETLSRSSTYMGKCSVSGPDEADTTLTRLESSRATGNEVTAYTFVTDTAGTYDFSCQHTDTSTRADAPFALQPQSHPTDWMVFGLPLAFLVFLPLCLATLIPGLRRRSLLKRYRAMGLPIGPSGQTV